MSDYETILFDTDGAVATITLNRPERLNAWTRQMMAEMTAAIEAANDDPAIGAIIVTGAGRGFCAGADIKDTFQKQLDDGDGGRQKPSRSGDSWVGLVRRSKPLIAAVNGPAIGVGLSMILPFDYLIAADTAKLSCAFVKMGVVNELGSSYYLVQRMGFGRASELSLSGRMVLGEEAAQIGLVDRAVPAEDLLAAANETAARIAANPDRQLRMIKDLLTRNGADSDIEAVMAREYEHLFVCYESPEHKEAVTAFLEKRQPDFRGVS